MIYVKTEMERMPEECIRCDFFDMNWGECRVLDRSAKLGGRRDDCPLVEINGGEGK